jgi:hypothetical protein
VCFAKFKQVNYIVVLIDYFGGVWLEGLKISL